MAEPPPSKRPAATRPAANLRPPPPPIVKVLPYAGVALVGVGLVVTMLKSHTYGLYAAGVLCTGAVAGLAWAAWQHSITLTPGDGLRAAVRALSVVVALAALGPLGLTLRPPAPAAVLSLTRVGERASATVSGNAATVFLQVSGAFKPDVGAEARARYTLTVQRAGGAEEDVEGVFERNVQEGSGGAQPPNPLGGSELTANRHVLRTTGAGTYSVIVDRLNESLQPPLRVAVHAEPISEKLLAVFFGLLALAVLGVDVALRRRNIESAFAASLLVMLAGVFYLHGHFTPATMGANLLAAGLVGVLGGGLGGEVLGRVADMLVPASLLRRS